VDGKETDMAKRIVRNSAHGDAAQAPPAGLQSVGAGHEINQLALADIGRSGGIGFDAAALNQKARGEK
jgi:hypothetical protein